MLHQKIDKMNTRYKHKTFSVFLLKHKNIVPIAKKNRAVKHSLKD